MRNQLCHHCHYTVYSRFVVGKLGNKAAPKSLYVCTPLSLAGWSLAAVKQALSHHRWQKDRMDMHASRDSGSEGLLHQKITGIVVDLVSVAFQGEKLLDRKELLQVLISQQQRAVVSRMGGGLVCMYNV